MPTRKFAFSVALEVSHVLRDKPGTLTSCSAKIDSTAPTGTYYLQLLNRIAQGADGALAAGELLDEVPIPHVNGSDDQIDLPCKDGIPGNVGLVLVLSSTAATLTASGAYLWVFGANSQEHAN